METGCAASAEAKELLKRSGLADRLTFLEQELARKDEQAEQMLKDIQFYQRKIAEKDELLDQIRSEAARANHVISLHRDVRGQGRVTVATAMHRIEQWASVQSIKGEPA